MLGAPAGDGYYVCSCAEGIRRKAFFRPSFTLQHKKIRKADLGVKSRKVSERHN